jgi:hypothetical protein
MIRRILTGRRSDMGKLIKRRYQDKERIRKGQVYAVTHNGGMPMFRVEQVGSTITVYPGCLYSYYEVDQEIAGQLLEIPPEPQHGEVWECGSKHGAFGFCHCSNGVLWDYRLKDGTFDGKTTWRPVRKVGTWLEVEK